MTAPSLSGLTQQEQLALLRSDVQGWNRWRAEWPLDRPSLQGVDLSWADLSRANLSKADLSRANLHGANLHKADLDRANLHAATLDDACLEYATLVHANLDGASLRRCEVFGASVWGATLTESTVQSELRITPEGEPSVGTDDIQVAQLLYLIRSNPAIRSVIDTVSRKLVLILGRFTPERKATLDALREALRLKDLVPVIFDFEKPDSRDLSETVSALAHLSRFVVADLTDAKSIPQELQRIIPALPSLPVQPLVLDAQYEYAMFKDFAAYLSVLRPFRYRDTAHLLASLDEHVIEPADRKAAEIAARRRAFEAGAADEAQSRASG
jgi:hypothetical protein